MSPNTTMNENWKPWRVEGPTSVLEILMLKISKLQKQVKKKEMWQEETTKKACLTAQYTERGLDGAQIIEINN